MPTFILVYKYTILIVSTGGIGGGGGGEVSFSGTETSLVLKKQDGRHRHFFDNNSTFFYCLFLIGRRLNLFIGDMYNTYTYETLNSRSSTECQTNPHSGLKKCLYLPYYWS